jgi:iron complex outermembrane receptor protein
MPTFLRNNAVAAAALVGAAATSPAAIAQSIDYQALQDAIGEPVTTSVTGKPQRASELPASTVIITRAEIARSPARDVPGLLKSYAGIDVNRWTAGQSDVAVRGGVQTYNARLLVLVDGRQVYLDHYGMTNWNLLGVQLEEIQQIELVRGPASALFGFNAASGVVNIITRRVKGTATATGSVELGNHSISRVAGTASLPLVAGIDAKVSAGRTREDERAIPGTQLRPKDIPVVASDHVSGELIGTFGAVEAVIGGGHVRNRQTEYLPSQLLSGQRYVTDNVHGRLLHDTTWGGLSFNGYVNWLDARYDLLAGPASSTSTRLRNRTIVTKGAGLFRLGNANTLRLGLEYRNSRLRSPFQFSDRISYNVASADAMLDLHPTDGVTVTAAGRIDRLWLDQSGVIQRPSIDDPASFDRAFTKASFNAAILVQTGENGQFRLNGGRGYQLPSLVNFGTRIPVVTPSPIQVFVLGLPNAVPVAVWSGELAYIHTLGTMRLEVTGFATRTNDPIATPGDGLPLTLVTAPAPVLVSRFRQQGHYVTYGTEISASGAVGRLDWRANYSWTQTDQDLPPVTLPIAYPLLPAATTSRHKANVTMSYRQGPIMLSVESRYTSPTKQFGFGPTGQMRLFDIDDALAIDARAAYQLTTRIEMFAAGENLSLADGAAVSPVTADRRVRIGLRFAF